MTKDDLDQIKSLLDSTLETHLAAVHEELTDLGTDVGTLRQEMRDGFAALKSTAGALDNRIDNETFARKDLEHRLRGVLPDLPEAARS